MQVYVRIGCVYVCMCVSVPCSLLGIRACTATGCVCLSRPVPSSPVQAAKAPVL